MLITERWRTSNVDAPTEDKGRTLYKKLRVVAIALVLLAAAAACGGDDTSSAGDATTSSTEVTPERGGTLTMGMYSKLPGIDPVLTSGAGSTFGNEISAVYDRLLMWNPETQTYDPHLAESVEPNAAFTEWTIKLRPNVKFGDGTAYDAAAVKFNFDRQKAQNKLIGGNLATMSDVRVVDPLTVAVTLSEPWSGFPSLLANGLGFIASPTAVGTLGANFAINPVGAGAGPFQVASFKPGEELVLERNPNYWNGDVYLDELRFVSLNALTYESLKTGDIDVAFLREAEPVAQSKTDGYPGYSVVMNLGEVIVINQGVEIVCNNGQPEPTCAGQPNGTRVATKSPGQDPDLRKAIALAIDVNQLNTRATDDTGRPATTVFDETFPWNPGVESTSPDIAEARRLVAAAKAKGWDGTLRFSCSNSPLRHDISIGIEAMLRNVGVNVDMSKANQDVNGVIADVITKKDYDIACWGLAASPDDWALTQLDSYLRSTSASNRSGYKNPEMDAALKAVKTASTDEAKEAGYKKIAELWNDGVPSVALFHVEERITWNPDVHGLVGTSFTTVAFDKAWTSS